MPRGQAFELDDDNQHQYNYLSLRSGPKFEIASSFSNPYDAYQQHKCAIFISTY